jgi:hypothetical protein
MSETPSKFDALGDLLGVQDDTAEIARPLQARRAVGDILRGGGSPASPTVPTNDPPPPAATEPSAETTSQQPGNRPMRTPLSTATETTTEPAAAADHAHRRIPGRRTSANLPVSLVERLAAAKRRRWELTQLVSSSLDHLDLRDVVDADAQLDQRWHETRVQRAYLLTAADAAQLDALAAAWRMNRSQVLTVILPLELGRLGL